MILTSIDRDGTMSGYDLEILSSLESRLAVPLVISGGAGNFQHLSEALKFDFVSGVACGSLFHFADNNPIRARSHLKNQGSQCEYLSDNHRRFGAFSSPTY